MPPDASVKPCPRCGTTGTILTLQRGHVVAVCCPRCAGSGWVSR